MAAAADRYGTAGLASKRSERALIARLAAELDLAPGQARALYGRVAACFAEFGVTPSRDGELCYVAVDADEPNHRLIAECRRVQVHLDLVDDQDRDALRTEGLAGMRRRRLVRLCRQAHEQGALLTIQDLAYLTCSSLSTVKRDLAECRRRRLSVPTRGHPGTVEGRLSRPARVAQLFLNGATPSDISRQVGERMAEVKRILADFAEVAVLLDRGAKPSRVRALTGHPTSMVAEYASLYDATGNDKDASRRLHELMTVPRR